MGRWPLVGVILTGLATAAAAVALFLIVRDDGITPEENEETICELANVLYLNTLNALARSLAVAETDDERTTTIAFFDTSIRRIEALPCDFTEVNP